MLIEGKLVGQVHRVFAVVTKTDLKEFESKQKVPAGQKRTPDYTGKRFAINLASETLNGDIFVGGQNFVTHGANAGGSKFPNTLAGQGTTSTGPTRATPTCCCSTSTGRATCAPSTACAAPKTTAPPK